MLARAAPHMLAPVDHAMLVGVVPNTLAQAALHTLARVEHLRPAQAAPHMLAPVGHAMLVQVGHVVLALEKDGIARLFVDESNRKMFRNQV
jgi:hypothetical protein